MKWLKSVGFKSIGNVYMNVTVYSQVTSALIWVFQLCFHIECPMYLHWCSRNCCAKIVSMYCIVLLAYFVCWLQQGTFWSVQLSADGIEKSPVLLLLLIYPTWLVLSWLLHNLRKMPIKQLQCCTTREQLCTFVMSSAVSIASHCLTEKWCLWAVANAARCLLR